MIQIQTSKNIFKKVPIHLNDDVNDISHFIFEMYTRYDYHHTISDKRPKHFRHILQFLIGRECSLYKHTMELVFIVFLSLFCWFWCSFLLQRPTTCKQNIWILIKLVLVIAKIKNKPLSNRRKTKTRWIFISFNPILLQTIKSQ